MHQPDDPEIASDAYVEFAYARYEDVRAAAATFPADRIVRWLEDPQTPWWQYGDFCLLLGHCGKPEHAAVIRKVLDDPRLFDLIATQHIPPGPGPELMSDAGRPHSGGHDAR